MVAVVVDVHPGLHAQSHHPGNPDYIPLVVTPKPAAGLTAGEVRYPPGEDKNYPELGQLNVYEDRVIAYVPVAVAADAKPGPVDFAGTVDLQAAPAGRASRRSRSRSRSTVTVAAAGGGRAAEPAGAVRRPRRRRAARATVGPPPPRRRRPPAAGEGVARPELDRLARHLKAGGLPFALAAAFVIGVLFNAVPCVLPVMPLKVMGFYEVSKHDRGRCLFLGAVFGAGMVSVFAVLGVLIVVLHVIDWGGLFQQTWFIGRHHGRAGGHGGRHVRRVRLGPAQRRVRPLAPARQRRGQLPVRHADRRPEHALHVRPARPPCSPGP